MAAEAVVVQRQTEFDLAKKNLARGEELVSTGGMSKEEVDTRRSAVANAVAAISKANADVAAADAAIATAESLVIPRTLLSRPPRRRSKPTGLISTTVP